jgi:hypothetical protein
MAMSNAERQRLWRQRHPGERRGKPQVRMTGWRVDLMLEEGMNKDLRQANAGLGAALDAAQAENTALRRVNAELTEALDAARAELAASKVVTLPRKKRQPGLFE